MKGEEVWLATQVLHALGADATWVALPEKMAVVPTGDAEYDAVLATSTARAEGGDPPVVIVALPAAALDRLEEIVLSTGASCR